MSFIDQELAGRNRTSNLKNLTAGDRLQHSSRNFGDRSVTIRFDFDNGQIRSFVNFQLNVHFEISENLIFGPRLILSKTYLTRKGVFLQLVSTCLRIFMFEHGLQ